MQLSFEAEQRERLLNDETITQMQLSLEAEQTRQDSKVSNLGLTNLLTKFIEILHDKLDMKLPGGANVPHSTQRYKTAAANLKSLKSGKSTRATQGLPIKYQGTIVNQYSNVSKLLHKIILRLASDKQIVS